MVPSPTNTRSARYGRGISTIVIYEVYKRAKRMLGEEERSMPYGDAKTR